MQVGLHFLNSSMLIVVNLNESCEIFCSMGTKEKKKVASAYFFLLPLLSVCGAALYCLDGCSFDCLCLSYCYSPFPHIQSVNRMREYHFNGGDRARQMKEVLNRYITEFPICVCSITNFKNQITLKTNFFGIS